MNDDLSKLSLAAQAVLYDTNRASKLLAMLATKAGAITAVHTVMSMIETKAQIKPDVKPQLSMIVLALMMDLAKRVVGKIPPPEVVGQIAKALQSESGQQDASPQAPPQAPPQSQPPAQPGLIAQGV